MTHRNRNVAIGSALLMVLMLFSYALIDRPVTLFCQDLGLGTIQVFQWITELGKSTGYLVAFFVLFVLFKYYLRRPIAANRTLFLFAAVALSGLTTDLIKPLVGRLRPKLLFEADLYGFDPFRIGYEYNSFPSGHATTVFALAAALSFFFPRWRLPLFSLAAVVGLSRIIVGAHYLSDVMAGAYVGVMTVFALVLFCRRSNWIHCRLDRNKEKDHA
jgi:membrane-associated phospholipid phosphatase